MPFGFPPESMFTFTGIPTVKGAGLQRLQLPPENWFAPNEFATSSLDLLKRGIP
jgi:hypothetical protein